MASSYTSTLTIKSSGRYARGYVEAWVSSETETTATIYWRILCQQKSAALYGQEANGYVDGSWVDWCGGYIDSSSSSWKDVCSASGYTTVNKTTAARSVPVKISTRVTPIDGYGSVTTDWAEATCYVSISAKTSYAVMYDANGGSGAPSSQTKYHGTSLTLSSATPTRENYNFLGWNTKADGSGTSYAPGATYSGNAALTLYAQWELAYHAPIVSNLKIGRCDAGGNAGDYGSSALVTFDWKCDQNQGANPVKSATVNYTAGTATATLTGTYSGTGRAVVGGSLSADSPYAVTVTVTDSLGGSTPVSGVIPSVAFPIDFLGNGKGAAFGKPAAVEGLLDVGYDMNVDGDMAVGGPLHVGGRQYGANKVLWSGGAYMLGDQTATLSEAISAQPNGVVLVWTYYDDGAAQDYDFSFTFIPKYQAANHSGRGVCCYNFNVDCHMAKYIYVYDTKLTGYSYNTGTHTMGNVAFSNSNYVLKYVIGV